MPYGLFSSVPTPRGKWAVVLLDEKGKSREMLPCECVSEAEACEYAKAYLRLYS